MQLYPLVFSLHWTTSVYPRRIFFDIWQLLGDILAPSWYFPGPFFLGRVRTPRTKETSPSLLEEKTCSNMFPRQLCGECQRDASHQPCCPPNSDIPRHYTQEELDWLYNNLPAMEEAGIITRCTSPWACKTKWVPKIPAGTGTRMVHRFLQINAATIKFNYPMRRMEPILHMVSARVGRIFQGRRGQWILGRPAGEGKCILV